jgi:hypothetical protein
MRAPSLAFGVLVLVGCERPTAPAANAPPVVPAQRAVDAAARPPLAPCERAAGEARKVLDHAAAGDAGADLGALRAMFTNRCMADPSGGRAWALVPERVRVDGRSWWARYALVRLGPEAGRFGAWPAAPSEDEDAASATPFNLWQQPGDSEVSVVSMSAYDYDRDGSPELALVLRAHHHEGPVFQQAHVWSFTEGGVFLYERALGLRLTDVRDVDGDGRPDLLTHGPYDEPSAACGSDFATQVHGPALALHALPDGSFSGTDAAARAFARTACPARPARLLARSAEGGIDQEATARNVVCARLWGAPEAEVVAAVRRECPAPDPEAPCAGCEDVELLARWAHTSPPLTLAEATAADAAP